LVADRRLPVGAPAPARPAAHQASRRRARRFRRRRRGFCARTSTARIKRRSNSSPSPLSCATTQRR